MNMELWALVMYLLSDKDPSEVLEFKVNKKYLFESQEQCSSYYEENGKRLFSEGMQVRRGPHFKFDCVDAARHDEVGPYFGNYNI